MMLNLTHLGPLDVKAALKEFKDRAAQRALEPVNYCSICVLTCADWEFHREYGWRTELCGGDDDVSV